MIAFGVAITKPEPYERYAGRGIRRAAEGDSPVLAFAAVGPVARTYNLILDDAGARDDLEALVLVHPHMEIADPDFCHTYARRCSIRRSASWGAWAPPASAASPGGRAS